MLPKNKSEDLLVLKAAALPRLSPEFLPDTLRDPDMTIPATVLLGVKEDILHGQTH